MLLLVGLATTASAQTHPVRLGPEAGTVIDPSATSDLLAMGGVGLGASALAFGIGATQDEIGVLVLAPLAAAVTVSATGWLRGRPGSINGALGGAVVSAVPGILVAVVDPPREGRAWTTGAVIGSVLFVALPPVGAIYGFETAGPRLFRSDTGEIVPGIALRVRL
ncbi:MAG: hypothetical protein AAGI52_04465 [Bacteroidota bacterium]